MRRFLPIVLPIVLLAACVSQPEEPPALHYLLTADQAGPVAYRDPVGAISPDGRWLANLERGRILFAPAEGGASRLVGPGTASIRYLVWFPDSRRVLVREGVFDRSRFEWWVHDREGERSRFWPDRPADAVPRAEDLDQLVFSPDAARIAGVSTDEESTVWILDADGGNPVAVATGDLAYPGWTPSGELGCLEGHRLHLPCGGPELITGQEVHGRFVFFGDSVIYAVPGEGGFLDLWSRPVSGGTPRRLTGFARDAYDPSVGGDSLVFKSQDYRVFLATAPAAGGPSVPLTTFQSETPTFSPDGSEVAFTFGSWRHVTDDIHYPDIAQHLGTTPAQGGPHAAPHRVMRRSYSEDQGMQWSPNGRFVVFHTHEDSDDIWLMTADGSDPRPISVDGHETGWARWSPDGRFIVFPSYRREENGARRGGLYVIGVDQETGEVTAPQREVPLSGFSGDVIQAEWADGGETLVFESAAAVGDKSLWTVPREGGAPVQFHRYRSDQIHSGIGISPDGRHVAYVDRAPDGFFQVFRVPVEGGEPAQVTSDPTHKTQPAWSPDGERIAFAVFSYRAHFWRVAPGS